MQHKEDRSAGQKAMPTLRAWFERGTGQPPLSASACLADVATLSEPAALLRAIERATQAAGEDGACALIISAMDSIVLHGRDCARLLPWIAAADELLTRQPGPAPVARAALALQRLVAALLAGASLETLARALAEIRLDIFCCDSAPLKVRLAGVEVYLHLFLGNLHRAEECIHDYAPLAARADIAPEARSNLAACCALLGSLQGSPLAEQGSLQPAQAPLAPNEPPNTLACRMHWLVSRAFRDSPSTIACDVGALRAQVVESGNAFLQACLHYALGIADLHDGEAADALDHARMASEYAALCNCPPAAALAALLEGQALLDLGRGEPARAALDEVRTRWSAQHYRLIEASAQVELACLDQRQGQIARARETLAGSLAAWPGKRGFPVLHRPPGLILRLRQQLLPAVAAQSDVLDQVPIQVQTFGEFTLSINGQRLFDRDWRGNRIKTVLKALIVEGGRKVAADRLCDLLWPNDDGDRAQQNLKVALSRLRHLSGTAGAGDLPWIATRHRHVSLIASLCQVDAILLRETLQHAADADLQTLIRALDLYKGDFLAGEDSPGWIVSHRELLRNLYLASVLGIARRCLETAPQLPVVPHLERAIELRPEHPGYHELLVRVLLQRQDHTLAEEAASRAARLVQAGALTPSPALSHCLETLGVCISLPIRPNR